MTSFSLKLLALITMIIDHIGSVFFPDIFLFRFIGRLAFPIYAFLISQGLKHTHNIKKYLKNLFILAFISEIIYDLCFYNKINIFYNMNTVYTLFIASFSIYLYNKNNICKFIYLFLGIIFSYLFNTDYSFLGVILIYIFYFENNKIKMLISCLCWATIKYFYSLYIIIDSLIKNIYLKQSYTIYWGGLYLFTLLSFFIIMFYNGKKGKNLKYTFYSLYPLHLILIYIVKCWLYK